MVSPAPFGYEAFQRGNLIVFADVWVSKIGKQGPAINVFEYEMWRGDHYRRKIIGLLKDVKSVPPPGVKNFFLCVKAC